MSSVVLADWLLEQPGAAPAKRGGEIRIEGGLIQSVTHATAPGNGLIALPGLVNAHDHARAISVTALGGFDKPLESWLLFLGVVPGVDPYLVAATSLGRSALCGAGRVMVHYTRMQGLTDLVTEAQQVARAALDVGVHVGFAVSMRNRNPIAYGGSAAALSRLPAAMRAEVVDRLDRAPLPLAEQLALIDEIAQTCAGPGFNVQYGPTGVQWCTNALLEAVAEASARTGRQVHMHLLETRYQREWSDRHYPQGVVRHLADIGLLSPRLTLAHCTHCRPDELALIAESGATITINASSNLALRSGVAPLSAMLKAGCRVAMGIDGQAFDEDDDALRELRLVYALHKGTGYDRALALEQAWEMAARHGRYAVSGMPGAGRLARGEAADILLLDASNLMEDRMFDEVEPFDFVLARASARHIRGVVVAGKSIVQDGRLTGIDYAALRHELLSQLRAGLGHSQEWQRTVLTLDRALEDTYGTGLHLGCC